MSFHKSALLLLATTILAGQDAQRSGIDRANLDPTCKPCTDFWRYANGGWVDKNSIPAHLSTWGTIEVMKDANRERLRAILETAAANKRTLPGSNERKIGDFYASCMDAATIDALGVRPIQAELDRISAANSIKELGLLISEFQRIGRPGVGPFLLRAVPDSKNSKIMILNIFEGGLSLPDRDYYLKEDAKSSDIREQFLRHLAKMFERLGDKREAAASAAKTVMAFETALAEATMNNVQRRDPYASYHTMDFAGLAGLTPEFDWKPLFRQFHISESTLINVGHVEFVKKFNQRLSAVPLDDWRTWLRWRVVNLAASNLSKPFADQDFHFNSAVLRGVKEQPPRWETCTDAVDQTMGEALGEAFVRKHFPPEAKSRMNDLVDNLRATLGEELQRSDWLAPETRRNAIAKLSAFVVKTGYPEKWRDYSALKIDPNSYLANVYSAEFYDRQYNLAKVGKPVDPNHWIMTPPTVNAYANQRKNEIVFPAGFLQPPMFDLNAEDAINYGAIGVVIGHEMGHHFDDQGSKFDA
jgi:putative endopeptidase